MNKDLLWKLTFPLAAVAGVSMLLHRQLGWDGFWLNLATEMIGIAVTVGYVDYVIRRSNSAKQAVADARVNHRLQRFVNSALRECRDALGYDHRTFHMLRYQGVPVDLEEFRIEQSRVFHEVVIPGTLERLRTLDNHGWMRLAHNLNNVVDLAERLIEVYSYRLDPDALAAVMDAQDTANLARVNAVVFPDVVPAEQVPPNRYDESVAERQEILREITAERVRKLLRILMSLSRPTKD